jgi:hypothetical protein
MSRIGESLYGYAVSVIDPVRREQPDTITLRTVFLHATRMFSRWPAHASKHAKKTRIRMRMFRERSTTKKLEAFQWRSLLLMHTWKLVETSLPRPRILWMQTVCAGRRKPNKLQSDQVKESSLIAPAMRPALTSQWTQSTPRKQHCFVTDVQTSPRCWRSRACVAY